MDNEKLRSEIAAIARGDVAHDEARKALIERAGAAKADDLVPDNWGPDGSLKESKGVWSTGEQRETYNDTYTALSGAICDTYQGDYEWDYVWVQDFTDEQVIFYAQGELWSLGYTLEPGGAVEFVGEPARVRPVTEYVPRAAASDLEWRKRKAEGMRGVLERRFIDINKMELREAADGTITLTGYASVTETPYEVGFYKETVKRGAFKRTLGEEPDVQFVVNHAVGGQMPLARTKSGTMRLSENDRGLFVEADLDPEDPDAQSLMRKMKRGDIDQMSFAFQATDAEFNDDFTERTIRAVSIHRGDVSVVNMAANPAATASVRDMAALLETRAGRPLTGADAASLAAALRQIAEGDEPDMPDLTDEPDEDGGAPPAAARAVIPDYTTRAAQELALLEMSR